MQLPVQALSVRVSMPWEQEGTRRRHGAGRAGGRRRRVPLRRGVPSRRDPARARGDDVDAVVRPDRHARLPRRAHDAHAVDDQRVHRRVPAAARDRQGVRHPRSAVERAHDRRHRRRARRRRVRRARRLVQGPGRDRPIARSATIADALDRTSGPTPDSAREVGQRPRPVQQPHPPIWIGGSGKPALRRVAHDGRRLDPAGDAARSTARRHRHDPARARPGAARRGARDRLPPRRARR